MQAMIRKSWLRKDDRSPSHSPAKLASPTKYNSQSPSRSGSFSPANRLSLRKKIKSDDTVARDLACDVRRVKAADEEIASPARDTNLISPARGNHFNEAYEEPDSPLKKFKLHEVEINMTDKLASIAMKEPTTPKGKLPR